MSTSKQPQYLSSYQDIMNLFKHFFRGKKLSNNETSHPISLMNFSYQNIVFNGLIISLSRITPSSTQKNGKITSGKFFIISICGIGFTSRLNCKRLAADNGVPVNCLSENRTTINFHLHSIKFAK